MEIPWQELLFPFCVLLGNVVGRVLGAELGARAAASLRLLGVTPAAAGPWVAAAELQDTLLPELLHGTPGSQSRHPWSHTWDTHWHSHSRNLLQLPAKDGMQWPKEGLTSITPLQDNQALGEHLPMALITHSFPCVTLRAAMEPR